MPERESKRGCLPGSCCYEKWKSHRGDRTCCMCQKQRPQEERFLDSCGYRNETMQQACGEPSDSFFHEHDSTCAKAGCDFNRQKCHPFVTKESTDA